MEPVEMVLSHLQGARRTGDQWQALCPAHEDRAASLSVAPGEDGRVLLKCFAGCAVEDIVAKLGLTLKDLFQPPPAHLNGGAPAGGSGNPPDTLATLQPPATGCTVARYAAEKKLEETFLRGIGVSDAKFAGVEAVRIPYYDTSGAEVAVRFRTALSGNDRFRWLKGSKLCLYGLSRLDDARKKGYVVLVEGESDAHTLWSQGIPAIGIPGAANWKEDRDAAHLDGIPVIYVVIEPDKGGEAVMKWLQSSGIRNRVCLMRLGESKDPSGLYLKDPPGFPQAWQAARDAAVTWTSHVSAGRADESQRAKAVCGSLSNEPRILDRFAEALKARGVVGEVDIAKLVYLAVTSRFLDRPVSIVLKGPSSGGKSFLLKGVLEFFQEFAYYAMTGCSERALAYGDADLSHRMLVIYESSGLEGDFASYLIRSLLSEGHLKYETVEKGADGKHRTRTIERAGPTGLIITTTATKLHPENETRLLSLTVSDSKEHTKAILRAMAKDRVASSVDMAAWLHFQIWLETGEHRVFIPYAEVLAEAVPAVAVRLRRDFYAVLNLIRTHAILHRDSRGRAEDGRIIAALDDYAVVRELVADIVAAQADASVPVAVRATVKAVETLLPVDDEESRGVTVVEVAKELGLDKSAAWRRVKQAIDSGYLKNLEDRKGRPARLVLGDPMPEEQEILPTVDALRDLVALQEKKDAALGTPSLGEARVEVAF